ncbi:MAG TPA: PilN domain-containing protein [Candidatus Eisenbacteria bacterium]|nr:PilN domain-containing protein [Candidatus Eisenbacteria bacterium]
MRRPDFLDGLGIYVGASDVTLAYVSKRLFRVQLRQMRSVSLPGSDRPAERRQALTAAVREFAGADEIDSTHTVLCVPRADAAVTRVVLPAAAQENLAQVLEYEMENLIPLPRNEVAFDYSVRPLGEERIEVLLVCLPREIIRGYLEALEDAEVRPRGIVLPSAAIADYVAFCRGDGPNAMGFVVGTPDATELALVADGRLLSSQLVPSARLVEPGALDRSLARQMADELVDPERVALFHWQLGNGGTPPVPPVGEGDLPGLARGRLTAPEAFFEAAAPSAVPAVGAALAAVREGLLRVNLLPVENREAFDEGPSVATWALLAASVLLLVVWGVSAIVKDVMLRGQLQARLEEIAPDVREVRTVQNEIDELQKQVEILATGQDGRVTTLLKELTELIPTDAYLTSFNLRGNRLTLDGQARSASDLITAMEKSKRFKSVSFSSPTTRQGDKERFSIAAEVVK